MYVDQVLRNLHNYLKEVEQQLKVADTKCRPCYIVSRMNVSSCELAKILSCEVYYNLESLFIYFLSLNPYNFPFKFCMVIIIHCKVHYNVGTICTTPHTHTCICTYIPVVITDQPQTCTAMV